MKVIGKEAWSKVPEASNFKKLPVGGYVVGIRTVTDVPEKNYLKIEWDICEGENKNWFKKEFDSDTRKDKKWSNVATMYRSYNEKALPMLKGFLTSVANSNKNFNPDVVVCNGNEQALKNKMFGIVIGEEEYLNTSGKVRIRPYIAQVHSADKIRNGDFKIPELKTLTNTKVTGDASKEVVIDPFPWDNSDSSDIFGE